MAKKINTKTKSINAEASRKLKKVVFPKVRLFGTQILTTAHTHTITATGIILQDAKGNILTKQVVVAAGPQCSVKIGETVEIAPERFARKFTKPKHDIGPDIPEIQVPLEKIDGIVYLYMSTQELKYVYTDIPMVKDTNKEL